ncbi:DUF502 domain-containing protein [Geminicoccaceae bacterium 1502E]|nr:DUF502 domain-containing protein [Geminicoccaceae bacterium 1502E]
MRRAAPGGRPRPAARLRNYLLAGIIVSAPLSITLLIVWQVVDYVDRTAASIVPARYNPETYLPFSVPGIGFLLMLGVLTLIGWFTAGLLGRSLMRAGEQLVHRMPVVRSIYGTLKQIFETVLANSSRAFREVVLIEYPRRGMWSLAFVSGPTIWRIERGEHREMVNVFLPSTPNPTTGFLLFVPRSEIVHLEMTIDEGMRMIISGGIVNLPLQEASARLPIKAERELELAGGG